MQRRISREDFIYEYILSRVKTGKENTAWELQKAISGINEIYDMVPRELSNLKRNHSYKQEPDEPYRD